MLDALESFYVMTKRLSSTIVLKDNGALVGGSGGLHVNVKPVDARCGLG